MRDESGRVVPPGAFLPAVERYNLSVRYDRWVIARGAAVGARPSRGVRPRVAVLHQPVARQRGRPGDRRVHPADARRDRRRPAPIGFETAECVAIGNLGKANQLITRCAASGCAFGLDDFGSGVSSFAYLKALGADYLKIDGMFVGNLSQDRVDYAMVRSIKDIGHVMGKLVIAEVGRERGRAREAARDRRRLRAGLRGRRAAAARGARPRERGRPAGLTTAARARRIAGPVQAPSAPCLLLLINRLINICAIRTHCPAIPCPRDAASARQALPSPRPARPVTRLRRCAAALLEARAPTVPAARFCRRRAPAQIAAAAGTTSAMIHYYFGDKLGLYRAMIEEAVEPLVASLQRLERAARAEPPRPRRAHGGSTCACSRPIRGCPR